MKKEEISEIDIQLDGLPYSVIILVKGLLDENNFSVKYNARLALVRMGKNIIPHMHKLLTTENLSLRMEAAKVVELIADKRSIPKLIKLLEEPEFDIRWVAGEGSIRIGRRSILPLLKSIRDGNSSLIFNKGAHHVLSGLLNQSEREGMVVFMQSLDDFHLMGEIAPTEADRALKTVFNCNS